MSNSILDAICVYADLESAQLDDHYSSKISINKVGDQLEFFIKDLVADSFHKATKDEKQKEHDKHFCWTGKQNSPPDMMVRGGDAIEVKKSESIGSTRDLNSSPPRQTLSYDDERLDDDCKKAEEGAWEKDVIYALGSRVNGGSIGFMWMVYGDCWCAKTESYEFVRERVSDILFDELEDDPEIGIKDNEIARVFPTGSYVPAEMRVRGMWNLNHPGEGNNLHNFSKYVAGYENKKDNTEPLFVVMRESKFNTFSESSRVKIEEHNGIEMQSFQTIDPDDPDGTITCVLIEAIVNPTSATQSTL